MSDTTTTRRPSRASRGTAKAAAKPATPAATDAKPAGDIATVTNIVGGAGRSATGDNRDSKTLGARNRKPATPAAKPATPAAKPASKPATRKPATPAAPVVSAAPRFAVPEIPGMTTRQVKRVIADEMIKVNARLASTWNAKRTGVPADVAAAQIGQWLAYLPECSWDDESLGERSNAGRRNRTAAAS